jgi:hypothetical protein
LILEVNTGAAQYKLQHNSKTIPGDRKHRSIVVTTPGMQQQKEREQDRKNRLKEELRERISIMQRDITRFERDIIVATEEKNVHQEDLQFHLELLDELGGFDSDSEEEEIFAEAIERQEQEVPSGHTETTGAKETESSKKLTRAEIQEPKDKARAWHLDREREKKKGKDEYNQRK